MKGQEYFYQISDAYMTRQPEITDKMRSILIDWLVEGHLKFKMKPETLFITVTLIDRYLEQENVTRVKLQLVGITALMIAGKYEEIYPPEAKDYRFISDSAYSK